MNENYKDQITHQVRIKESYLKVPLACANQAVNGGTAAFVLGNEAFSMDCMKLSNNVYEGVKQ